MHKSIHILHGPGFRSFPIDLIKMDAIASSEFPKVCGDIEAMVEHLPFPSSKVKLATFLERITELEVKIPGVQCRRIVGGYWTIVEFKEFAISIHSYAGAKIIIPSYKRITHCELLHEQLHELLVMFEPMIERLLQNETKYEFIDASPNDVDEIKVTVVKRVYGFMGKCCTQYIALVKESSSNKNDWRYVFNGSRSTAKSSSEKSKICYYIIPNEFNLKYSLKINEIIMFVLQSLLRAEKINRFFFFVLKNRDTISLLQQ